MSSIIRTDVGSRLKAERERLVMQQTPFAEIAGVSKGTLIQWEKGTATPNAESLASLAGVGVDVLFVVTGQRSLPITPAEALGARERALLENYKASGADVKKALEKMALLGAHEHQIEEKQLSAPGGRGPAAKAG